MILDRTGRTVRALVHPVRARTAPDSIESVRSCAVHGAKGSCREMAKGRGKSAFLHPFRNVENENRSLKLYGNAI